MSYYPATAAENIRLEFSALPERSALMTSVDLWFLDVSKIAVSESATCAWRLTTSEWARAQQFKKHKHRFLATRVLLRAVLTHYTGIPALALPIARTAEGKPFLTHAPHPLYFNLTHSGNCAVLAITGQGEVGADIETMRNRSYLKIAEQYFHPDEIADLHACEAATREQLFYRLWTLKEAFFKAVGTGIVTGLDKAYFSFQPNKIDAHFSSALNIQKTDWQFHQEFIAANTVVAIAVNSANKLQPRWFDGHALLVGERRSP